ncbi:MAG: (2Fe-2S)-binding protein, partial [Pseudomonas sp.]|nr:(2Fe-2S)-binding protein [Pseudomonas sp.]
MSEHSSAAGQTCTISLELNGERRELQVQPWTTLLDLLRDQLGL